jgi:hypothetical protein
MWFQDYADRHHEKGDAAKAARNQERADYCRNAAVTPKEAADV